MRRYGKTFLPVLMLLLLTGIGNIGYSSQARSGGGNVGRTSRLRPPHIFDISLEPAEAMKKNSPITLNLTYEVVPKYYYCGDSGWVTVTTLTYGKRDTLTNKTWSMTFDANHSYSTSFQVLVPDNDTTELDIRLGCGVLYYPIFRTFVTTGDKVQFIENFDPRPRKEKFNTGDPIRDTLTEENLRVEYEVILNVRKQSQFETAEKILGKLPDSCIYERMKGYYKLKISLKNLIRLADSKVGFEYSTPPPWAPEYKPAEDSVRKDQPQSDTLKDEQSLLLEENSFSYPGGISLESVDGQAAPGELLTGEFITFCLDVNSSSTIY